MTIQTTAIFHGNYFSQDQVRGMTGGHSGAHEILLGRGGCCAAAEIMPKLALNISQWKFWDEPQPQHAAFVRWLRKGVEAGETAAFGVFMATENNTSFDHIVPLVGFDEAPRSGERLVFNDLHANVSLREPIATFVASRSECRKSLPWKDRFAYCLPSDVNYGIRVHGNADVDGVLFPAKLIMDDWTEPDYSKEDGKGERPKRLGAWVVAWQLTPGDSYALLVYTDPERVPQADFLSNRTGGVVARSDFVARSATYRRRVSFMSDSTTFYRVVRRPSSAHLTGA